MSSGHYILVLAGLALFSGIYFFGPVVPADKESLSAETTATENTEPAFDFNAYKNSQIAALEPEVAETVDELATKLEKTTDKEEQKDILLQLIQTLETNENPTIASYYRKKLAMVDNTEEGWVSAGDQLAEASYFSTDNAPLSQYLLESALEAYRNALEINQDNLETKVKLASGYMDNSGQVMQGVALLLEVVEQEPKNIAANLILGRYGIISGQFDKAIARLTTVVEVDSSNAEAYFYLAEAYNGLGDKEKAITLLEKCKNLVENPNFAREIDGYIQQIKNS